MYDITLLGDRELEKKLIALDHKVAAGALKEAIKKSVWPVKDAALAMIPVSKGALSFSSTASRPQGGPHMRDTISIKTFSSNQRVGVTIGVGTRKQLGIPAGYEWFYPMAVETGHVRAAPHPFMRPALDRYRGLVLDNLKRELGAEIERIAKGA